MFGDSMFEGGDVNATDVGGNGAGGEGSSPGTSSAMGDYGSMGFGAMDNGAYAQSQSSWTNASGSGDPAEQAQASASAGADYYSQQASQASNTGATIAGSIGHAVGLSTAIGGIFGHKYKRQRVIQRRLARQYAQAAIDNSQRALDQYKQDSAINQQKLQQSYAGRGVGQSSMYDEGMQYYNDTTARKMAALQQNVQLAQTGQLLNESQISTSYAETWNSLGNSIMNLV